jgi:histone-lysine N-methyltransferase SETMAR
MSNEIFRRFSKAVRRKHPENYGTNIWFILHDNAPTHRSVLVKDFIAKNNVTALEHPTYSSDLTAADFYLFPQLKSQLKGRHFFFVMLLTSFRMLRKS